LTSYFCYTVAAEGIAGVGKDTVAAEVVNSSQVQSGEGLQAWLQASSEIVLQQQLVDLFAAHRPEIVQGIQNDLLACLAAIKEYLAESKDWILMFEDASPQSATMWGILPADHTGRVLVTSQAPLHENHEDFTAIQLDEISTSDSINLLLKGGVFKKTTFSSTDPPLDDVTLQVRCIEVGVDFIPSPPNEKPDHSRKRKHNMTELFLPLSVSMVGQMARSDPSINSTLDLISVFNKGKLNEAWVNTARNNMTERHYFGLAMSIHITLERMDSNEHFTLNERREAKVLLCALSRLDRTKAPMSLLTGHGRILVAQGRDQDFPLVEAAISPNTTWVAGFKVRVVGLVSAAHHNGKMGFLSASKVSKEDRVGVELDGKVLSIRKENLELVMTDLKLVQNMSNMFPPFPSSPHPRFFFRLSCRPMFFASRLTSSSPFPILFSFGRRPGSLFLAPARPS
jgi:hypothetical protein